MFEDLSKGKGEEEEEEEEEDSYGSRGCIPGSIFIPVAGRGGKFPGETWVVSRNLKGGFRFKMEIEIGGRRK